MLFGFILQTADVMYDIGAGLEVASPLCPQHFLPVAGMANLAKVFLLGSQ